MYGRASARIFALSAAVVPVRAMVARLVSWVARYSTVMQKKTAGLVGLPFRLPARELLDRDALRLDRGLLRQRQLEHAIRVLRLDRGFLDRLAERKRAVDLAVVALGAQDALAVLHVLLVLDLGRDGDGI